MPAVKDYPADYSQSQLFPDNVFDLLPDDHDCFVYRDVEHLEVRHADVAALHRQIGRDAFVIGFGEFHSNLPGCGSAMEAVREQARPHMLRDIV